MKTSSASARKAKKKTGNAEFIKEFTKLTVQHFSTLTTAEQNKQLRSAENRLGVNPPFCEYICLSKMAK